MPTVSIYIRNSDLSKYLEIENKSEFIHNALNHKLNLVATELNKPVKTPNKIGYPSKVINMVDQFKEIFPEAKTVTPKAPKQDVTYKRTQNWGA